jgi:hypothetical protein
MEIKKIYLFKAKIYFLIFLLFLEKTTNKWGLGIGPNPQSPIPNPQSPIPNPHLLEIIIKSKLFLKSNYKVIIIFLIYL